MGRKSLSSSPVGGPDLPAKMLEFCARHKIASIVEESPMSKASDAMAHLASGETLEGPGDDAGSVIRRIEGSLLTKLRRGYTISADMCGSPRNTLAPLFAASKVGPSARMS